MNIHMTIADLMPHKDNGNATPRSANTQKKSYPKSAGAIAAISHSCKPDMQWTYHDRAGQPIGIFLKWNKPDGKDIVPLARRANGRWVCKAMPMPRPLYRLPELLAESIDTHACVVECEKCDDTLTCLALPATTSAGGARAKKKTDWTPLAGRTVNILPNNDPPRKSYAEHVVATLNEQSRETASPRQVKEISGSHRRIP